MQAFLHFQIITWLLLWNMQMNTPLHKVESHPRLVFSTVGVWVYADLGQVDGTLSHGTYDGTLRQIVIWSNYAFLFLIFFSNYPVKCFL